MLYKISTLEKVALIVAGGSGSRMNAGVPKQFLLLCGIPVLIHTLNVFHKYDKKMRIIIALPLEQISTWQKLCRQFNCIIHHEIRPGGETRFHTVRKNLEIIPDHCLVAIHDGVRPLVSIDTITRCFDSALEYGNAVPCIEIPETMRKITQTGNQQVDHTQYRLIQTPQVFESSILKTAYFQEYKKHFTDDAGVVESIGQAIKLVEGNPENIKITYKKDLRIAASLLKQQKQY
jgi:2-C-methyl-D-erythritol 4-phosphate cytidylyltransferase